MAKDNTFSGMAHNALTAETTIVGKIVSQKDIRIDGTLEGRLECQGKVVIGETGQVGDRARSRVERKVHHVAAARRWRRCLKDCYFFRFGEQNRG